MANDREDALQPEQRRALLETVEPLLDWFEHHQRQLPWRAPPRGPLGDPYAVWVSEIMLQQTQVATVIPYFTRWMERFPTLEALAAATEAEVLEQWQGLGYYRRARNLLQGARFLRDRGSSHVPRSVVDLLTIPGVGEYSAGAIASIGYGVAAPVVDGNVVRVLTRLLRLEGDPHRMPTAGHLREAARALVEHASARPAGAPSASRVSNPAGALNQSLMELGATLCTPTAPRCDDCPLARHCAAYAAGVELLLPRVPPRAKAVELSTVAAVVRNEFGACLLVQLPDGSPQWAGLWVFPFVERAPSETVEAAARRAIAERAGLEAQYQGPWATIRHSITRYRITLTVVNCSLPNLQRGLPNVTPSQGWFDATAQRRLPMPAPHRRIARGLAEPDSDKG